MDALASLLKLERLTAVVDVGADPTDGSGPPPYTPLLERGLCTLVGFEPQREPLGRLIRSATPNETYLSAVLGDGGKRTLRILQCRGMSSTLKPNAMHLSRFNVLSDYGRVVEERVVETERLDDVAEIARLDFLKADVQGAELEIFQNGRERLSSAVAVQTEVALVTMYERQPTLADVDRELRSLGFMPHTVAETKLWPIGPLVVNGNAKTAVRQVVEMDLVYVRDFTDDANMTAEQWKHLALIAHHCYGSVDLAGRCIEALIALGALAPDALQSYVDIVREEPRAKAA